MSETHQPNPRAAAEDVADHLHVTQQQIVSLLASVADDEGWQPAPGEWSFRDIAAHLAATERECFLFRVERIASGEKPFLPYYDDTSRDFGASNLLDASQAWAATRQNLLSLVRDLPDDAWTLTGTHEISGPITILDVLKSMLGHDQDHLRHLQQLMATYPTQT